MELVQVIVAAGGEGRRFGGETPKQLVRLAGRAVLEWSVDALRSGAGRIVVVVPAERMKEASGLFAGDGKVRCVPGGASRWESVLRGLAALEAAPGDLVAIHDAARPAVDPRDVDAVIDAARDTGAAILGRPVSDTVKRVRDGTVAETVDRRDLFRAETPQVFERRHLDRCRDLAAERGLDPTDESSLVELLGDVGVRAVAARHPNPKITFPGDLARLESLLASRGAALSHR